MDVSASAEIFGNPRLNTVVVNSQTIKDAGMKIERTSEYPALVGATEKGKLGTALFLEMENWMAHSRNTMGDVMLADPVTVLVAGYPNLIGRTDAMRVTYSSSRLKYTNDKMPFRAVGERTNPHLYFVRGLNKPQQIRQAIIGVLDKLAHPKSPKPKIDLEKK